MKYNINDKIMVKLMPFIVCIAVCCVLPVMCVWLITRAKTKAVNKKMDVLIKAIENGAEIDPNFFENMESEEKSKRKLTESLNAGVMLTLMGIGFILFAALDFYSFSQWGYLVGVILLCVGISSLVTFFFGLKYKAPEKPSCGQTDGNE